MWNSNRCIAASRQHNSTTDRQTVECFGVNILPIQSIVASSLSWQATCSTSLMNMRFVPFGGDGRGDCLSELPVLSGSDCTISLMAVIVPGVIFSNNNMLQKRKSTHSIFSLEMGSFKIELCCILSVAVLQASRSDPSG